MVDPEAPAIRPARGSDAAALLAIYRPFVERTTVTFEVEVPSVEEFAARIEKAQERHAWLVAEDAVGALGYAYATLHRGRAAYRYTAEVSAYVDERARRRGVGRALYERLFELLVARGYCNAVAGITLPNDRSVAFHERLGFRPVGVYHGIGYKAGAWRDVAWYERRLRDGAPDVVEPGGDAAG